MTDGIVITDWVMFGVFVLYSFILFMACYTVGHHYGKHESEERIKKLRELLQEALPHIECKNNSQSGLITEIGEYLETE